MNEIKTSPRGFPFDERTLQEIQDQTVPVLNAIGHLLPDNCRIYGVELPRLVGPGSEISAGFIRWGGEFLPFVGGQFSERFSIIEEVVERAFNVGTDQDPQLEDHPAYILRYAMPGEIAGAESVHSFSQLNPAPNLLTYFRKGEVFIGTVVPTRVGQQEEFGTVIEITFPALRHNSYLVLSSFYRANVTAQGSFDYDVFSRRPTGFKIRIRNVTDTITHLFFQFLIIPKQDQILPMP